MKASSDPSVHRLAEQRFVEHVERVIADERLRVDTTRGRKPASMFIRSVNRTDKAVDLKRLMSELRKPDRELQNRMPLGQAIEVDLVQKKWWVLRETVGKVKMICLSPSRTLLENQSPAPLEKAAVERYLADVAPATERVPSTVVLMSTSGFTRDARELAARGATRTLILVEPNDAGGFAVYGPVETAALNELFDPEAEEEKRNRIRHAIDAGQTELSGSGVASDRIAAKTQLPAQLVEAELKSYARETPGLAAKRLDGRVVLFREGSAAVQMAPGGNTMPMIDKIRSLFARRGETEKKIAFLSERRAALGQQRDRAYEEVGSLEQKDAELRDQFKSAGAELAKRRITSQLLQLRKDMERRQQLLGVLNQQINVVSTHLHNLELVQQGQTAKLPDSEEMATDAAAAEEMLATLQESGEMAETVGGVTATGMSSEEQALYDELLGENAASSSSASIAEPPATNAVRTSGQSAPPAASKQPPRRSEPEAG